MEETGGEATWSILPACCNGVMCCFWPDATLLWYEFWITCWPDDISISLACFCAFGTWTGLLWNVEFMFELLIEKPSLLCCLASLVVVIDTPDPDTTELSG